MSAAMKQALKEARGAFERGEVPIGAAVVSGEGDVVASDGNRTIETSDPSAHAEMLVLRKAAKILGTARLFNCDLYVTLEPCTMCAGVISFARIRRLYYGAEDEKGGGIGWFSLPTCHHAPEVYGGIAAGESAQLLQEFFRKCRKEGGRE
ncbi:MAG: nucleoside deaminase [Hyphomicrobiales bacterium]|nr:nucleoside deaminase [Hyphomicrobiales bacterium]